MSVYSPEFKEQLVKKMMPPNNQPVTQISRENGVSVSALYKWKKQYQAKGFVVPAKQSRPDQWDTKAKLAAIIQTASMNEAERSGYCREHGIYPEQLDAWKAEIESFGVEPAGPVTKALLANERKKSRRLEKELRRKEKALAETAALLTLSKKARAIWGEDEED